MPGLPKSVGFEVPKRLPCVEEAALNAVYALIFPSASKILRPSKIIFGDRLSWNPVIKGGDESDGTFIEQQCC